MTDAQTIARLQKRLTDLMAERDTHKRNAAKWQGKCARQAEEGKRKDRVIAALKDDKARLLADLKWIRGEAA